MTDLVDALRANAQGHEDAGSFPADAALNRMAADEIERLRRDCAVDVSELYREIERLRARAAECPACGYRRKP